MEAKTWFYVAGCVIVGGYVLTGAVSEWGEWHVTGEGRHLGYVTAIEKEGWFWRTWTLYFKTDTQSTQEDQYCIRPVHADLVPALQRFAENHTRVELGFETYLRTDWSECQSTMSQQQGAVTAVRTVS